MALTLGDILRAHEGLERPYLSQDGEHYLSYGEVCSLAERNARFLARLRGGCENVALLAENTVESVTAYWSLVLAGATVVLLSATAPEEELVHWVVASDANWVVVGNSQASKAARIAAATGAGVLRLEDSLLTEQSPAASWRERGSGRDIAVMLPTSGSTGGRRLVMLRHQGLVANAAAHAESLGLHGDDIAVIALPLCFSYAHTSQLLCHTQLGGRLVLHHSPLFLARSFCKLLERSCATVTSLVPSLLYILSEYPYVSQHALGALRLLCFGGAPPAVEVVEALRPRLPDTGFAHTYGLTEASPRVTTLPPREIGRLPSIGRPIPGVDIQVVAEDGRPVGTGEVAELCVRGISVMAGYYGHADASAIRDGWLHTGDLARCDGDGYLHLAGRKSNLLMTGGVRVSPEEVEAVLLTHPAVKEAQIIGEPSPALGDALVALLVLREGEALSLEALHGFLRGRLGRAKWPRRLELRPALAKTQSGKIRRST
jgi:long-chain acyl-CoA synthetase